MYGWDEDCGLLPNLQARYSDPSHVKVIDMLSQEAIKSPSQENFQPRLEPRLPGNALSGQINDFSQSKINIFICLEIH